MSADPMPQKTTDELRFFTELTQVPRPSGHHERINDYLREFAEYRGLAYTEDPAGNVLIRRKGNTRTVVLHDTITVTDTVFLMQTHD